MARPKSWFEPREFATAKKIAKTRKHDLWKFTRNTRAGKKESGYYVGTALPARLQAAETQRKTI